MQNESATRGGRKIPLSQWTNFHPWPSVSGLRWLRFNCRINGFEPAFYTVGRRVLVDEDAFWRIVEEQNGDRRRHSGAPDVSPADAVLNLRDAT